MVVQIPIGDIQLVPPLTPEEMNRGVIRPGGKRRERATYYRQIPTKNGEIVWVMTSLLPSDPLGKQQYLAKGFRLTPPEGTEFAAINVDQEKLEKTLDDKTQVINDLLDEVAKLKAELEAKGIVKNKGGRPPKRKDE